MQYLPSKLVTKWVYKYKNKYDAMLYWEREDIRYEFKGLHDNFIFFILKGEIV